ncbi:MAG: hypothetical protein K2K68_08300, partial [Duncaniella sp.]|nr:hypothetical protein [Duncaniella sp.]
MAQKTSLRQDLTQRLHQTLSPAQLKFVRLLEMNQPEVEEEVRHELEAGSSTHLPLPTH